MGLFSRDKPKIKIQTTKKDGYSGWLKCTHCTELIHLNELEKNFNCCPKCEYHYRLNAEQRLSLLLDPDTFHPMFEELRSVDALQFTDIEQYSKKLQDARDKSKQSEAAVVGTGQINGIPFAIGVMDFNFMAGSMGSVVGERLTRMIEYAIKEQLPVVVVSTSGGARMQESTLSLMQMAKTSAAFAKLHEANLPYVSILTNPTLGGVTASFATLGDIIIAEPNALIGFAGPRVIEQGIRQKLPEGAQKSEFLLEHGMIDCIIKRSDLKKKLSEILDYLINNERPSEEPLQEEEEELATHNSQGVI